MKYSCIIELRSAKYFMQVRTILDKFYIKSAARCEFIISYVTFFQKYVIIFKKASTSKKNGNLIRINY